MDFCIVWLSKIYTIYLIKVDKSIIYVIYGDTFLKIVKMLLETCCFSVLKEEILGKKWQGKEKRHVTASMRKAMNIFGLHSSRDDS